MEIRYSADPLRFAGMTTEQIRGNFLVESLFKPGTIEMVYSDIDRVIAGSAVPTGQMLRLQNAEQLRVEFFCQRRELGILNIGRSGVIAVDGKKFAMDRLDCLYVGKGSKEIFLQSDDPKAPAMFYMVSYPAAAEYPTTHISQKQARPINLGSAEKANKRTIFQYIHPDGVKSCQLVMGFTGMAPGCVWNTMPPHTHERRMEVYMYFDFPQADRVFHLMGQPDQTRHIVVAPQQAVISPSWSIHSGVGTAAYSFCWAMGGENQAFDDMDHLSIEQLK